MTLEELVKQSHENSKSKGFWDVNTNIPEKLMLIVSELSEALEEYRKGGYHMKTYFDSEGVIETPEGEILEKPEGFSIEIADAFIRLGDLCGYLNIDIAKEIATKAKYNAYRPFKHGGKKA